ncbi:MAG: cytochrome c maturation protein CcmE [Proteobacteria bacterium]|jgi:cytochrome c-type biogenesis protein CcmE|nr:cytochrome c maturation protein CcmE [Pseudomonadota bacterium]
MKFRQTKWIIGIAFVLLGLGIILTTNLPSSLQYYVTVDEFFRDVKKYDNLEIKMAGKVVPGSIVKAEDGMNWKFDVQNEGKIIPVTYRGAMPDTFKDEAEVVVTGTYKDPVFAGNHVLAKCASRYEEKLTPNLDSEKSTS